MRRNCGVRGACGRWLMLGFEPNGEKDETRQNTNREKLDIELSGVTGLRDLLRIGGNLPRYRDPATNEQASVSEAR
jgi:hypothetical protein